MYKLKENTMSNWVVKVYQVIECNVVKGYIWIERKGVNGYKLIEKAFVNRFLDNNDKTDNH